MSALGEYIHLKKENYEKYGTARKGEKPQFLVDSYNAQRAKNDQLIKSIKDISPKTIEELKKRISNESTQKEAMETAKGLANYNQSINDITKQLEEKLLSEVPSKFSFDNYGIRIVKSNLKKDKNLVNIEEAKKARRRLYDNIDTINRNTKEGKPVRQSTIDTLLKNTSDFFNYLGIINNNLEFLKYRDLQNANTLAALKNIVQLTSLSDMNKAALHGAYGETLVHMADDVIRYKSGKELENTIKEALKTGETRTEFQIDEKMIAPIVQKTFQEDTGINLYQIRATQDKVDASISINDQNIEASIKAYTPKGNIVTAHLQDVSLITNLLATENQFANHWINLHAHSISNTNMDNELQRHIEYEALAAGNLLKKGSSVADTFVVIDAVNGKVYSQSVKEILTKGNNNFILKPILNSIRINNNYAQTLEQRISNILLSLHQQKISVSYKVSLK